MTRIFFSWNRAKKFEKVLIDQGFENVEIWQDRDGFNQTIYIVKWY